MRALIFVVALFFVGPAFADDDFMIKKSAYSVTQTIDKLEAVLTEKGLKVFSRIDHGTGALQAGLTLRPSVLLIFGNPKIGTPLMQSNPLIGLDLPLKALAYEDEDGTVRLAVTKPDALKDRFDIDDRDELFKKMKGALDKFTDAATQ